jgi:membrane protease YdiL (CAAX protease family)
MRNMFLDNTGRLRSGWRAAIFVFAFFLFASVFRAAEEMAFSGIDGDSYVTKMLFFTVNSFLLLIIAVLFGWLAGKLLENLPFRAIGAAFTDSWLKHLLLGAVIGAVTLCLAVIVAVLLGGEKFETNLSSGSGSIISSLGISFVVFAIGAAWEEAFFRGYVLQTFSRSGLAWVAVLLTSVFFGIVHLANTNANTISTANTVLAGLWFSVAYLKTRDLWFVWGMHLMWNWMQGSFFGIEVSGMTDITTAPLLREIDAGPIWLTGQTYGIEGGIVCTIALILSTAAIHFLPILRPDKELLEMTTKSEPPSVAGG